MKYNLVLFPLIFIVSGCTTTIEFVRKDSTPEKKAVVRYPPPSSPAKESKYRAELTKQATNFCGGDFNITKEYQAKGTTGGSTGIGTGVGMSMGGVLIGTSHENTAMYNFVEFSCQEKQEKSDTKTH